MTTKRNITKRNITKRNINNGITNNRDTNKSKWLISGVFSILLIILYITIFTFSEQDGVQSSGISGFVSKKCAGFLDFLLGGKLKEMFSVDPAIYFENPIRKMAHFMEYAFMGFLVFMLWRPWINIGKKLFAIVVLWVFVSAAFDEIHQLYVPGRWGCFADVCLDTSGGSFGYVICVLGSKLKRRKIEKME